MLVALNAATWQQDVAGVKPGGVVVHEESFPVKGDTLREDLTYYAVPFAALAKEHFADKGDLRKYLMNMIYVGTLAQLLEIPPATIEERPARAVSQRSGQSGRAKHERRQRRPRVRARASRKARSVALGADGR